LSGYKHPRCLNAVYAHVMHENRRDGPTNIDRLAAAERQRRQDVSPYQKAGS
jgi:hypothetical protein